MTPADAWASHAENVYGHRKRLRFVLRAVEAHCAAAGRRPADLTVLDVGCGTGVMLTLPLASLGYRVTGIDPHAESVARARGLNRYPNAAFRAGDPGHLLAAGERYDVVVASEVLEHIPDPLAFLRVLQGLLRPDGILVLTTPNGYGWFEAEAFLWERLGWGPRLHRARARWTALLRGGKWRALRLLGRQPRPGPPAPAWAGVASTENPDSPHVQRFRWGRLKTLLASAQFAIADSGKSAVFAGEVTHCFLGWCRPFIALNTRLADWVPRAMAAGWYLVCRIDPTLPRSFCLADSSMMSQATALFRDRVGAPPTLALSFRQLRQQPGLALRLPFRRFDMISATVGDVNHLYRDAILVYLWLLSAPSKALHDVRGAEVRADAWTGLWALARCLADCAKAPVLSGRALLTVRTLSRSRQAGRWRIRRGCWAAWRPPTSPSRMWARPAFLPRTDWAFPHSSCRRGWSACATCPTFPLYPTVGPSPGDAWPTSARRRRPSCTSATR
jgi:2-polyprenyl-3-methyl-5-hydroxy-6-metoxy-1,4-benzoquinol methylase